MRKLVPVLGEARLIQLSGVPFIAGLLAIACADSVGWLLLGLALLALGFGGTLPSVASLLSRVATAELQASVLGIGQSVGSLARIVGPTLAGIAYDLRGIAWPYLGGAWVAGAAHRRSRCVNEYLIRDTRLHRGFLLTILRTHG